MAEVANAAAAFLALAPQLLDLGNKWHKANRMWERVPAQLENLREQHEWYMFMFEKFGIAEDHFLREKLEEAKILLESEQKQMTSNRWCSFFSGCCYKVNATLFPDILEKLLEEILDAYDRIPALLQQRKDARELIKSTAFHSARSHSFIISEESVEGYVRLQHIEKRMIEALENRDGPTVIQLHGNPGTGKSILARHMSTRYRNFIRHDQFLPGEILAGPIGPNPPRENTPFSSIVFLECGAGATETSKQLELLQKLAPEVDSSDLTPDHCADRKIWIENRLQSLLRRKNALIILDDVWNPNFLHAFTRLITRTAHSNVKLLVTSRKAILWEPSVEVETEPLETVEAEHILASHAGLPDNDIPQHFKDVAHRLIDRAEYNPLALAMMAKRITRRKNKDSREWERVADSYMEGMSDGDTRTFHYLQPVLDFSYEKSIQETLLMTYRELKDDAKRLLILIANCEGKSIPTHVVYMLYSRLVLSRGGDPRQFDEHKYRLMDSGAILQVNSQFLVNYDPTADGWIDREYETLGLHDLQRKFINQHAETRKDVEEVMAFLHLLDSATDKHMRKPRADHEITSDGNSDFFALCALYLREPLAEKAARNLGMSYPDHNRFKELRGAMENLAFLMQDKLPGHDKDLASCAKQVYVKVVYSGELDDSNLKILLSSLRYGPGTICTLSDLAITKLCSTSHVPRTINSLLESSLVSMHHDQASSSPILRLHLHSLGCLAMFSANGVQIVEFPGALEGLVDCLSSGKSSILMRDVARILGHIAAHEDGRRRIGKLLGQSHNFVRSSFEEKEPLDFKWTWWELYGT